MIDNIIELYGKKVLLLENAIQNKVLPDPNSADVWIVSHSNPKLVKKFLVKMMQSNDLSIYLKPIFLQKENKKTYLESANYLKHLSDGYLRGLDFLDKITNIETINNFIESHKTTFELNQASTDEFLTKKILNYYYSRKKSIVPIINRKSLTGYSYPRVEMFFSNRKEGFVKAKLLLREAFLSGLFSRSYVDTSHVCKNCFSGFLNYREICPKCSGHNLKARDLIHHFRCAYVGIEKDYTLKDRQVCPKCSSELKNLGVDYDKPGKIFICKTKKCNHEFQEAPIGVFCIDCKTEQLPEDLLVRKIYSYELTSEGYQQVLGND